MSGEPTDEEILNAIKQRGSTMTYVLRNMFWGAYRKETPWYLRRLKKLEREGKVERVPTSYAVMICWRATGAV